jgi:hypothetical protein
LSRQHDTRLVVVDNQGGRQVYVDSRHYNGVVNLVPLSLGVSSSAKRGIGQLQVGQIESALCVPGLTLMAAKTKRDAHVLVALQPHLLQYSQESTKTRAGTGGRNGPWGSLDIFPGLEE